MKEIIVLLLFVTLFVSSIYCGTTYTWIEGAGTWSGWSSEYYWSPIGLPGPEDNIIFPAGAYVTVQSYGFPLATYPFATVNVWSVASVTITARAYVTITDAVFLNSTGDMLVEAGGYLTLDSYIGGLDGLGDLIIDGTLNIYAGNIQGTGAFRIDAPGVLNFLPENVQNVDGNPLRETYIFRNLTIYGSTNSLFGTVVHFGFWWQPGNVSVYVGAGGTYNLDGYFSKYFEGFGTQYEGPFWPYPPDYGSLYIDYGGYAYIFENLITRFITNYGVLVIGAWNYQTGSTLPWSPNIWNFGTIDYEVGFAGAITSCKDLAKWIKNGSKRDIQIYVDSFASAGIWDCVPSLSISNSKIEFVGSGGLIFSSDMYLKNARLAIHDGVDVVFTQQFHAQDSSIFIPANSNAKMMFMPKDADGYHNYLDKTVTIHPENYKKISFSGVKVSGKGSLDMLSELNLEGSGLTIVDTEVFFQREYGTCAITGAGDLTILKSGFASFGIESTLSGSGKISIFGKAEISPIASVISERHILVQNGGKLSVEGKLDMTEGAQIVNLM